ncbi:hypothetical protein [Streptomyces sp. NPDC002851]
MARILVKGDDFEVRLSWLEKAAARRGSVRVPLAAVQRVVVEPDWWRALRGVAEHGVWIPGVLCVGTRGHPGGQDFAAIRPGNPVICVELRPGAPFRLLAFTVRGDAEATADELRSCAPDIDASTPCRQPVRVAEETEDSWKDIWPQSEPPRISNVARDRDRWEENHEPAVRLYR